MIVDELGRIPMSPFLKATLARGADYAAAQAHREVTLEHLLLALAEDPEAGVVLKLSNVDIARLMSDVSGYLGRLEDRVEPGQGQPAASISSDLERILKAAAAAAQQGRRREINGAIVLAAVVGDGRTPAAHMLRSQGLTFEGAIRALQRMATQGPALQQGSAPAQLPPPAEPEAAESQRALPPRATTADDLLASARERVRARGFEPARPSGGPSEPTARGHNVATPDGAPARASPSAVSPFPGGPSAPAPLAREPVPAGPDPFRPAAAQPGPMPQAHAPEAEARPSPHAQHQPRAPEASQAHPQAEHALAGAPAPGLTLDDAVAGLRRERTEPPRSVAPQWEPVLRTATPQQGQPSPVQPTLPMPPPAAPAPPQPSVPIPSRPGGPGFGPEPQLAPSPSWAPPPAAIPPPGGMPPMGRAPAPLQPTPRAPLPVGAPSGGSMPARPSPPPPWQYGPQEPRAGQPPYPQHDEALARLDARRPPAGPVPRPGPAQPQPGRPPVQSTAQPSPRTTEGPGGVARPAIEPGQLHETLPRKLRVGIPVSCEVLIARADVKNVAERLQTGGAAYRHEVSVTRAMTVRLRAPDGGFVIETTSPETQWIENILNLAEGDSARWRWMVTARERGKKRLQLVVSARTVDGEGLTAETALPDKIIEVRVSINYGETAKRWAGWIAAAVIGGVLARFGDSAFDLVQMLMVRSGGS